MHSPEHKCTTTKSKAVGGVRVRGSAPAREAVGGVRVRGSAAVPEGGGWRTCSRLGSCV